MMGMPSSHVFVEKCILTCFKIFCRNWNDLCVEPYFIYHLISHLYHIFLSLLRMHQHLHFSVPLPLCLITSGTRLYCVVFTTYQKLSTLIQPWVWSGVSVCERVGYFTVIASVTLAEIGGISFIGKFEQGINSMIYLSTIPSRECQENSHIRIWPLGVRI